MSFEEIAARAEDARESGREVVAVLGLGFVGTAVVANLSRTERAGRKAFLVIGLDRDDAAGRDKVARLNEGIPPAYAEDAELERVVRAAAAGASRNLVGTVDPRAIGLADVVVCCINLDLKRAELQTEELACDVSGYGEAMRTIGRHMRPGALVCVESTLPLGASDRVLYPALCAGLAERGVDPERDPPHFAYCYERVMPGPNYLDSVNSYWRAYAGIDEASADRAEAFLRTFVDVERYPLWRHKTIRAAEMAKLLENAYRATNIAFIDEWCRVAEQVGVDLFDVVDSIRVRKGTHDNMMYPGLGVGGYCLTKDALLAAFGAEALLGVEAALPFSRRAILTNERMPLRAVGWIREHFGRAGTGPLAGRRAAVLGVTYRPAVADTRSSPAEAVARALRADGVLVVAYDPLVSEWPEVPEVPLVGDLDEALRGAHAVVVCLPDAHYKQALPLRLADALEPGAIVVDPWNVVAESVRDGLARKGIELRVYGRGDVGG
jgi:nucleotide sugar dehydrogenase